MIIKLFIVWFLYNITGLIYLFNLIKKNNIIINNAISVVFFLLFWPIHLIIKKFKI